MDKITIFDTSVGSRNIGDQIINELFNKQMAELINNSFTVRFPTHCPVTHFYQNTRFCRYFKYIDDSKYKFIVGTNIIHDNLIHPWPTWNINLINCRPYKNSIIVAGGLSSSNFKFNLYTKILLKKILSKKIIHSTRDEKSKIQLEKLGLKAINTGCVTMWGLTREHCKKIKEEKSDNVVFTLTDYNKDEKNDQELIDVLITNYKKVYFWIQGDEDLDYFNRLKHTEKINVIGPQLNLFKDVLNSDNIDYVGTRLHAGILALNYKVRTIIIIVDNRAKDIKDTYNIVALERNEIKTKLNDLINSKFKTSININEDNIKLWKEQFYKKNGELKNENQ